jgi:hypothetical protein
VYDGHPCPSRQVRRALKILQALKEQGWLAPVNEKWIGIAEERIEECEKLREEQ